MDSLFEFDKKYNIIPNPEVLIFPCFKKLWDRDTSKDKNKAISLKTMFLQRIVALISQNFE